MCVGIYKALRHKGSFLRKNLKINFTISYIGLVGLSINLAALPVLVSKQPLKKLGACSISFWPSQYFELFQVLF